jgi:MFS family permease
MAAPLSVARAHPGVDSLNRRVQLASAAHSFGNCVRWTLVAFLVTSRLGLGALGVVSAAGLAGQGLGFLLAGPGIAVVGLRRLLAIGATTSALAQAVLLVCLGLHSPATALIVVNFAAGVALQCFGMAAKSSAVACAGPSGMAKAVAQASVAVNAGSYAGTFVGALVWAMFGDGVEFALAAVLVLPSLAGLEAARARHWEPLSDGWR